MRRPVLPVLRVLPAGALCLALLAAACGDDDDQQARTTGDRSTTTSSSTTSTTVAGEAPTDGGDTTGGTTGGGSGAQDPAEDGTIVTLDVHGGFVPVDYSVGNTAELVLIDDGRDGRLISGAPTIAIYPGPALPAFQVGSVPQREVDAIVAAVAALDPKADYDPPGPTQVADAPDTTVTLIRDGRRVSITAYALGMLPEDTAPRRRLQSVVDRLNDLAGTGAGDRAYEPTALRVHDIAEQAGPPPESPDGIEGTVRTWPLRHDGVACTVVRDAARRGRRARRAGGQHAARPLLHRRRRPPADRGAAAPRRSRLPALAARARARSARGARGRAAGRSRRASSRSSRPRPLAGGRTRPPAPSCASPAARP